MNTRDEVVFQAFLDWLPTAAPAGDVTAIMKQYRQALLAKGTPDGEVSRQLDAVTAGMNRHDAVWPLLFDKIYASDTPTFRTVPNALLEAAVVQRPPGEALEVCMGEGRNAVYLAAKGWTVTGCDVSETGLKKARARARELGVRLTTVLQDSEAFEYGMARWDLVALIYAPVPVTDAAYVTRLGRVLRPGGLIVVESFASAQTASVRRAVDIDPEALQGAFAPFKVVHFEDTYGVPDWSQERGRLVRLVAEKP